MIMRLVGFVLVTTLLTSCYSPTFRDGLPCSETDQCPTGQRCDLATGLCGSGTGSAVDASSESDASIEVDASTQIDGSGPVDANENADACVGGAACDGPDSDACPDDQTTCTGGAAICENTSGDDDIELCNQLDDDCDTSTDEGFDLTSDEANCGECGSTCTNTLGTTSCTGSVCVPQCSAGGAQCDGNVNNGCELINTNPVCQTGAPVTTMVNGDADSTAVLTGTTEQIVRIRIRETNSATSQDVTARIALTSGAGTNYDLFVLCPACGSAPLSDPADDTVEVGRNDGTGVDVSFDVWVDVRHVSATTCAPWTLTITGNVATVNRCGG
jgi:hypothetical protein